MKNHFRNLFGLKPDQIRKNCILVPFAFPRMRELFQIDRWEKGQLFSSGNSGYLTLIQTRIGAPFVGDAVLYLAESACENLLFLGSCGLVHKTPHCDIGSLLIVKNAYAIESFTEILTHNFAFDKSIAADKRFSEYFSNAVNNVADIASLGSIRLETNLIESLRQNKIDAVDMETAAFLHAAKHINRKAAALLFVTDILNTTSPFSYSAINKKKIEAAQLAAVNLLIGFCEQLW